MFKNDIKKYKGNVNLYSNILMQESEKREGTKEIGDLTDNELQIYSQLISIRNTEINQFWRRLIILVGIQGVILPIFIGSFTDIIGTEHDWVIFFSIFLGFLLSLIITLIVRSNSFWKCFWENKLKDFETKFKFSYRIFEDEHPPKRYANENSSIFAGYISATKLAFSLTVLFTLFWFFLLVYYGINSNILSI